jgi:hypothetical protein
MERPASSRFVYRAAHDRFSPLQDAEQRTGPHFCRARRSMGNLLWLIIIILIILWLGGFALHIGGGIIHILLVIALILLIYRLATGRKVL